jgi:hypothetical protein
MTGGVQPLGELLRFPAVFSPIGCITTFATACLTVPLGQVSTNAGSSWRFGGVSFCGCCVPML